MTPDMAITEQWAERQDPHLGEALGGVVASGQLVGRGRYRLEVLVDSIGSWEWG